jgi:uncharacterized repeat protein (TIGR01451 family)
LRFDEAAPLPDMTVGDITLTEGNTNLTTGYFNLELSEPSAQPVSIAYITESGSALAGEDFIFATGVVELAAGVVSAQIAIDIVGDNIVENNETFHLRLYDPQGVTLATDEALATILNDDQASTPEDPPGNDPEIPPDDNPGDDPDDDPDDPAENPAEPAVRVTLKDSLLLDSLHDQRAGADDTLRYTLIITNTGSTDLTGLRYETTVPEHTRLAADPAQPDSTAGAAIVQTFETLAPGDKTLYRYDVVIATTIAADVLNISHQGRVYSDQLAAVLTDDPDTSQNSDATLTLLFRLVDIPAVSSWMLLLLGLLLIAAGYVSPQRRLGHRFR